jgi:hypothetical protein
LRRACSIEVVSIPYQSSGYRAKKLLLGPPLKTAQLAHERISKRVALAVFSSDPISSTAYATEEMLLVLVVAGTAAIGLALPVALAIVALLALLVVSYRQVVDAYPSAGGAYVVSRDNFGNVTAAVAGSSCRSPSWSCSPGAICAASARRGGSSPSPPTCTWSPSGP